MNETPRDPYVPQAFPSTYAPQGASYAAPATGRRPGWLTAVCVVAIVLGSLCLLQSIAGTVMMAFQEQTQKWVVSMQAMSQPGMTPELKKVQEEMYTELWTVQHKWHYVTLGLNFCLMALGALFLLGGIKALSLSPFGRKVLLAAFIAAAVYEVARLWPQIAIQHETSAVTSKYTSRIFDLSLQQQAKGKPVPPQIKQTMQIATDAGMIIGAVFVIGWSMFKLVGYGLAIWYLLRAPVRALYANEAGPATVAPV